ncbi:hypothetical protein M1271_00260 [Patescibacteria group bacterium]|nr:hypothetical protein [Patescibacteria group bacterium]
MSKYNFIYIIISVFCLLTVAKPVFAKTLESGAKTSVTADIAAKTDIRLFGYTAANSIVQATSIRVFAQVSSDRTGYFVIDPLPISQEAKEICVTTIDSEKRSGFPTCISLPDSNKPTEIGPLLLSPTLSLSQGSILQSGKALASGRTIPSSEVVLSFFAVPNSSLSEKLTGAIASTFIPDVEAADLPLLTSVSDQKGFFSINLPTSKAVGYRLFAKAYFKKDPTPKSSTLAFTITPYSEYWLRNVLPILLFLLLLVILLAFGAYKEYKTHKLRKWLDMTIETKIKPFIVRSRLKARRAWYNLKSALKSK